MFDRGAEPAKSPNSEKGAEPSRFSLHDKPVYP